MIVIFIVHLLKVGHAGCFNVVLHHFSIIIDLIHGVNVVVIIDDELALVVCFLISNAKEEKVFGKT